MCEKIFNLGIILDLFTYFGLCTLFYTDQCHKVANDTIVKTGKRTDSQNLSALMSRPKALIFTKQKMMSFCTFCWQCTCVQNSKKQDALWSHIKTIPWFTQTTPSIHDITTLSSDRMLNLVWWQLAKLFGKTWRRPDDALMNLDG